MTAADWRAILNPEQWEEFGVGIAGDEEKSLAVGERYIADTIADWRCECGDLNRMHEAFCFRCGAGQPEDAYAADATPLPTSGERQT